MKVSKKNRQTELDIAKGLGIILVVWAHAEGPFSNFISGFHMPFFFFISGMLYRNKGRSIKDYTLRKCTSLLLPFWWWNLILYPISFVFYYWKNWNVHTAVKGIVQIVLTVNKAPFLGATWFLASLFWVSVGVHILATVFRKYAWCDLVLLTAGIFIAVIGFQITFPLKISRTLICFLFYVSGYLYQKYIRSHIKGVKKLITALISIILYILIANNFNSSMGNNTYDNKILFVVGAYLAIYFTLWFSETLCKSAGKTLPVKHIIYLGENSIDLVIWQFLAFRIAILVQIIVMSAPLSALMAFPVFDASGCWWILYLLTGIYGSLIWKYILKHNSFSGKMKKLYMIR